MAYVVLDASAVLVYLQDEPGADLVASSMLNALISPVNVAEVVSKLIERGFSADAAEAHMRTLGCEVATLDARAGQHAGRLHERTRGRTVSLGDRFCLSLAEAAGLPVLTGDRTWKTLGLDIDIEFIR